MKLSQIKSRDHFSSLLLKMFGHFFPFFKCKAVCVLHQCLVLYILYKILRECLYAECHALVVCGAVESCAAFHLPWEFISGVPRS